MVPNAQILEGIEAEMKEGERRTAKIQCPICKKDKITTLFDVEIPISFFEKAKEISGGIVTVDVKPLCKHRFVVYIDLNLKTRGYQIPDLAVREIKDRVKKINRGQRRIKDIKK